MKRIGETNTKRKSTWTKDLTSFRRVINEVHRCRVWDGIMHRNAILERGLSIYRLFGSIRNSETVAVIRLGSWPNSLHSRINWPLLILTAKFPDVIHLQCITIVIYENNSKEVLGTIILTVYNRRVKFLLRVRNLRNLSTEKT